MPPKKPSSKQSDDAASTLSNIIGIAGATPKYSKSEEEWKKNEALKSATNLDVQKK